MNEIANVGKIIPLKTGCIVSGFDKICIIAPVFLFEKYFEIKSKETIQKINEKWSNPQTICGPVLTVPYSVKIIEDEIVDNIMLIVSNLWDF